MIQSGVPLRVRLFSLDQCGVVLSPQDMQKAADTAGISLPIKSTEALYEALLQETKTPEQTQAWLNALAEILEARADALQAAALPYPAAAALLKGSCEQARLSAIYLKNEAADELA